MAFAVTLFAFELTREVAVLNASEGAAPNDMASVFAFDGFVTAVGSWKRIDGGGELMPGTVKIECQREASECIEASMTMHDKYVYAPSIDRFTASFAPDAVTYENDLPDCAKYSVRIDLKLKKAFAVRQKKDRVTNPNCAALENRIEMQLADGYETKKDALEGHFVPFVQLLVAIF